MNSLTLIHETGRMSWLVALAVRLFGWLYFYKDRTNDRSMVSIGHH